MSMTNQKSFITLTAGVNLMVARFVGMLLALDESISLGSQA
jgi:hypothetical protein